ncbi:MAG: CpsD/CapB family tyrosine-protein kinase [Oscillospiraceae bacterium]|nr:CpsD/CapB family tyrosine-protein kinase [Oscillospiraceae bacterium]
MIKKKQSIVPNNGPHLITDNVPFEYVEAYKAMRTNFNFVTANGKAQKIIVTSSLPNEGKSTVAINLAISLAQADNKVLLIDADLRNPVLRRYLCLKVDHQLGLSALLNGDVKVGDCLIKTEYDVDVIASGPTPPNPAELIRSDAMRSLLEGAAENYDYIICDTPPVGVITDAAALSPLCDGVLYVIRQKYSNKSQVRNAIKKLQAVDAKILGTILCQYEIPKRLGKGYGYYHSYRYRTE